MQVDQRRFNRQPFQESIDTAFFFAGAGRRECVDRLKEALHQLVPLVVLTGEQGSGKTMICRMVERELPAGLVCVFLPKNIEAFDELIQIVAQEVRIEATRDGSESLSAGELIQAVAENLRARSVRLLVVFDEAEKIYLATLERIRRVLDQVNGEGILFQFLFSGRPELLANFQQLRIVSFAEAEERRFELEPLSEEETRQYVNYCITIATGNQGEFLGNAQAAQLAAGAAGNFREINRLARDYLESGVFEGSFLSLLGDIEERPAGVLGRVRGQGRASKGSVAGRHPPEYLDFSRLIPGWLLYAGGGVAVVVLLLLLYFKAGDDRQLIREADEVPEIELVEVLVDPPDSAGKGPVEKPDRPGPVADPVGAQGAAPPAVDPDTVSGGASDRYSPGEDARPKPAESEGEDGARTNSEARKPAEATPPPAGAAESAAPVAEALQPETAPPAEQAQTAPVTATAKIPDSGQKLDPLLETTAEKADQTFARIMAPVPKAAPATAASPTAAAAAAGGGAATGDISKVQVIKSGQKKQPGSPNDPGAGTVVSGPTGVDELFQRRLAAGARWLVGASSGMYTVQLMVLTADDAEENLKQMLAERDYREIAEQLYVLRRSGDTSTVMVYYGLYPSLAAARNARNNLPVFLRKHHPYAISVRGAVDKAQAFR